MDVKQRNDIFARKNIFDMSGKKTSGHLPQTRTWLVDW